MITQCPYLRNTTKLAHKRGLLPKGEVLECKLEGGCDQIDCRKIEDPNYRTIFIEQGQVIKGPSQKDKLYMKLERCLRIRRERGY